MLQEFTWQQFFLAITMLSLVWLLGVLLLYYRKELLIFLRLGKSDDNRVSLSHRWDKGLDILDVDPATESAVMGKPKLPPGMSSVSMGNFGFVQSEQERENQIGLIPDVLQELKEIFLLLEKEDGDKKDFFNMMAMLKEKFPKMSSHPSIPNINQFINEHAPFHLSLDELENLWD